MNNYTHREVGGGEGRRKLHKMPVDTELISGRRLSDRIFRDGYLMNGNNTATDWLAVSSHRPFCCWLQCAVWESWRQQVSAQAAKPGLVCSYTHTLSHTYAHLLCVCVRVALRWNFWSADFPMSRGTIANIIELFMSKHAGCPMIFSCRPWMICIRN